MGDSTERRGGIETVLDVRAMERLLIEQYGSPEDHLPKSLQKQANTLLEHHGVDAEKIKKRDLKGQRQAIKKMLRNLATDHTDTVAAVLQKRYSLRECPVRAEESDFTLNKHTDRAAQWWGTNKTGQPAILVSIGLGKTFPKPWHVGALSIKADGSLTPWKSAWMFVLEDNQEIAIIEAAADHLYNIHK